MINNSQYGYGWVSIVLHWLMAITIIGLFGLGLYMVELDYYDPGYRATINWHKSIGLLLAILYIARLGWTLHQIKPQPIAHSSWQALLAKALHALLYILLLGILFSGYLISTADGRSIEVFELFAIPALPFNIEQQEDLAGQLHWLLAWSLIISATMHGLAALQHHFIVKDNTLKRMLWPPSQKPYRAEHSPREAS